MPVQLSVSVRNTLLVEKHLEDFSAEVKKVSRGRIFGRMQSAKVHITRYPERYAGKPAHRWASEKQRRYVMAAIRAGKIEIPYQRTGRFGDSWEIVKTENGYTLRSNYGAARWIVGTARDPESQYHLHKTRWTPMRTAVEQAFEELPKAIQGDIAMVARRKGFTK